MVNREESRAGFINNPLILENSRFFCVITFSGFTEIFVVAAWKLMAATGEYTVLTENVQFGTTYYD